MLTFGPRTFDCLGSWVSQRLDKWGTRWSGPRAGGLTWPYRCGGGRAAGLQRPGLQEACTQQEAVRGQRPQE